MYVSIRTCVRALFSPPHDPSACTRACAYLCVCVCVCVRAWVCVCLGVFALLRPLHVRHRHLHTHTHLGYLGWGAAGLVGRHDTVRIVYDNRTTPAIVAACRALTGSTTVTPTDEGEGPGLPPLHSGQKFVLCVWVRGCVHACVTYEDQC